MTWRRAMLAAGLALGLSGCVTTGLEHSEAYSGGSARWVFATGYENIHDVYIEALPIDQIVVDGLNGLTSIDSGFAITREGDQVMLVAANGDKAGVPAPQSSDPVEWADLTAQVVELGRARSPQISAATAERVYEAVFDAALTDLDRFSRYASADAARENRANREGFGGVGITVELLEDAVMILSVLPQTPAEEAGLRAGDRIVGVGAVSTAGMGLREVIRLIRGPVNSVATLQVLREGEAEPKTVDVRRALIVPPTVTERREDDLLYIRLSGFNQDTTHSLKTMVSDAVDAGWVKGIVLDLRGNPGGLLDQAVAVADLFLESGQIVSTRGRHPDSTQLFDADSDALARDVPIAVLINGASASAAEIVAGALQDRGRAVLIGTSSFGKGSVQTVIRLPNDGELTLTWAYFHAPSGYSIHRLGVFPSICTSETVQDDTALLQALRHGTLVGLIDLRARRSADATNEAVREAMHKVCPWQPDHGEGVDLEVAKVLLHNADLYQRAVAVSGAAVAQR